MATYDELRSAFDDSQLRNRIQVGLLHVAYDVIAEADGTTNHANRLAYAFRCIDATSGESARMTKAVLLKNESATLSAIVAASDATIKLNIEALWNEFADQYAAA